MKIVFFTLMFFLSVISFGSDYSFLITGDLPSNKMNMPKSIYTLEQLLPFHSEKEKYTIIPEFAIYIIKKKEEIETINIEYIGKKRIEIIQTHKMPPENLPSVTFFFEQDTFEIKLKPVTFPDGYFDTKIDLVKLSLRRNISLKEIVYTKKRKMYKIISPPENTQVKFESKKELFQKSLTFNSEKDFKKENRYIFLGYESDNLYALGYRDNAFDLKFSNNINRIFFKNNDSFAGAEFSKDTLFAEAFLPQLSFNTGLENDFFTLKVKKDYYPFEFGLGIINLYPLPIINWYSKDFGGLLSLGCDVFDKYAYGINFKIKNEPFSIAVSSGYNFKKENFHSSLSGTYKFDQLLLTSTIKYSDYFDLGIGFDYGLINNYPWFLKIYGNIGYSDFSDINSEKNNFLNNFDVMFGTELNYEKYRLNINMDYKTGGLKFNVEAGYTF